MSYIADKVAIIFVVYSKRNKISGVGCPPDPLLRRCHGPSRFYIEVKCKPIFEKEDDCCPAYWDCPFSGAIFNDRCVVNGKQYAIGTEIADEDILWCFTCKCVGKTEDG